MESSIKNIKINHTVQLKKLALKSQDESLLLEDIRLFMKRKSEIEQKYQEEQLQLCNQFLSKRNPKFEEKPTYKAWYRLLEETVAHSKIRADFATKLREDFANNVKTDIDDKRRSFAKFSIYGERLQESLQNQYGDLTRSKQVYDQSEKESQKAFTKYEELQKPPSGTFKKIKLGMTDLKQKADIARKKYKNASRRAHDSRNEYFLSLESTNAHQERYSAKLLPFVIEKMDGNFFEIFKHHLLNYALQEKINCTETVTLMDNVIAVANNVSREADYQLFLTENSAIFQAPSNFAFEAFPNDPLKSIVLDEVSKIVLSTKLGKKKKRLEEIEGEIARKNKEIDGIVKIGQVYNNNPNFGKANEAHEELDTIYFYLENLNLEKAKILSQIDALTKAGVEVLNPAVSAKSSSKKKRVVALYDFNPERDTDLSVRVNDVITVVEDGDEWIKGELNGKIGLFPANYARPYEGEQVAHNSTGQLGPSRARALYDFEGTEEGDLPFKAGDVIEIVSKDEEWWEGRLNGKTGVFPMLFVEEEDNYDAPLPGGNPVKKSSSSYANSLDSQTSAPPATGLKRTASIKTSSSDLAASSSGNLKRSTSIKHASVVNSAVFSAPNSPAPSVGSPAVPSPAAPAPAAPPPQAAPSKNDVVALYDYTAQVPEELSFKKGDIIEVTNKNIGSDSWWEGKLNGVVGQFPKVYVKELDSQSAPGTPKAQKVEALYDYVAQYEGELSIKEGDIIELLSKTVPNDAGGDWWEGRLNGVVGQFPKLYVREL